METDTAFGDTYADLALRRLESVRPLVPLNPPVAIVALGAELEGFLVGLVPAATLASLAERYRAQRAAAGRSCGPDARYAAASNHLAQLSPGGKEIAAVFRRTAWPAARARHNWASASSEYTSSLIDRASQAVRAMRNARWQILPPHAPTVTLVEHCVLGVRLRSPGRVHFDLPIDLRLLLDARPGSRVTLVCRSCEQTFDHVLPSGPTVHLQEAS